MNIPMNIPLTDDEAIAVEEIEVRELDGGLFEVLASPLFLSDEILLGDIMRAVPDDTGTYVLQEVVERPFRHSTRMIPGDYGDSQAIHEFGDWVHSHGGRWEALMGGLLFLHFPRGKKMPRVKAELRLRLERFLKSAEYQKLLEQGPLPIEQAEATGKASISVRKAD